MRRTLFRLTIGEVKKLSRIPGRHADGGGLYLQVSKDGVPSWTFRYMADGRERYAGLGPLHTLGLKEAREKALAFRKLRLDGRDPLDERRSARLARKAATAKAMTFEQCAEAYIETHKTGWRSPKSLAAWQHTLQDFAYPVLGALPVDTIDTALVMRVLQPIWNQKTETASRTRGRIEAILDWAATSGFRNGESRNPAKWAGHLANLLPRQSRVAPVEHHAALAYAELPVFMTELRSQDSTAAAALEFTILTASRTGEAIGARFAEFDLPNRLWTVPAERMKTGKEHRVALSERAVEIVETQAAIRESEFVFPGQLPGKPLSNMAMLMLLRRMGRSTITTHGFRSAFADWCAERTNFPGEVREMALAHAVGSKVEAAYRRGDMFAKRQQLAEAWARYCAAPAAGDVVPLRRKAAASQ